MIFSINRGSKFNCYYFENFMRWLLPIFFATIFLATAINAYGQYLSHNPWVIGDWLVNYQGGMVRRGILGELFLQLSLITSLNPGIFVFIFQILLYLIYFSFSYLLLNKQRFIMPYYFLIFSPFIFTFQLNDPQGGFRKEILYFATFSFMVYSATTFKHKTFKTVFYSFLLLYPILIMSHEMLAIFLPYFLIVYVSITNLEKKEVIKIIFFLMPSVVCFLYFIYSPVEKSQVILIVNSLSKAGYAINGGIFDLLDKSARFGMQAVWKYITWQYYYLYPLILLFAAIAFVPILKYLKLVIQEKLSFFLFIISVIGTIPLCLVAIDWGRFLYVHLVSVFLLSFIFAKQTLSSTEFSNKTINENMYNYKKISFLTILFFIIYSSCWHIPHCGQPIKYAQSYHDINMTSYAKPFVKAIKFLFQ